MSFMVVQTKLRNRCLENENQNILAFISIATQSFVHSPSPVIGKYQHYTHIQVTHALQISQKDIGK